MYIVALGDHQSKRHKRLEKRNFNVCCHCPIGVPKSANNRNSRYTAVMLVLAIVVS